MTGKANSKPGRSNAPGRTWEVNPLVHCRRVVITFLQDLFAQAPKGHFKWSMDSKASEIFIGDSNPVRLDEVGNKPCITCTRSPVQFAGLVIDDFQFNVAQSNKTRLADLLSGNMAINCLARHGAEAEYLGWICARHLWVFRKKLIKQGFHEIARRLNISAPTAVGALAAGKNVNSWRKVTVIVPFHFRYSDFITPEAEIVNKVNLTVEEND